MQSLFNKILILFIGLCFASSVLEIDAKECKQNYDKEQHSFISANKTTINHSVKIIKEVAIIKPIRSIFQDEYFFDYQAAKIKAPPPKSQQKLFIKNSSLLI